MPVRDTRPIMMTQPVKGVGIFALATIQSHSGALEQIPGDNTAEVVMEVAGLGALETLQEEFPEFCDDLPVSVARTEIVDMGPTRRRSPRTSLYHRDFSKPTVLNPWSCMKRDIVRCQLRETVLPPYKGTLSL